MHWCRFAIRAHDGELGDGQCRLHRRHRPKSECVDVDGEQLFPAFCTPNRISAAFDCPLNEPIGGNKTPHEIRFSFARGLGPRSVQLLQSEQRRWRIWLFAIARRLRQFLRIAKLGIAVERRDEQRRRRERRRIERSIRERFSQRIQLRRVLGRHIRQRKWQRRQRSGERRDERERCVNERRRRRDEPGGEHGSCRLRGYSIPGSRWPHDDYSRIDSPR